MSKATLEQGQPPAVSPEPSMQIAELSTEQLICKKGKGDEIEVKLSESVEKKSLHLCLRLSGMGDDIIYF